jgi:hypothetical protein
MLEHCSVCDPEYTFNSVNYNVRITSTEKRLSAWMSARYLNCICVCNVSFSPTTVTSIWDDFIT